MGPAGPGEGPAAKLMDIRTLPNTDPQPLRKDPFPVGPMASDDDQAEGLDFAEYWRIVRRHKWGILSIALLCTLIGLVTALTSVPVYQAQVRLLAEPIPASFNAKDQATASQLVWLFYETQFEIIQSRAVAERVVDKLGLVAKSTAEAQRKEQQGETGASGFRPQLAGLAS